MECHLEAKLEMTIFAYSLEKGMSITDEIRVWQDLGHNIYQQYLSRVFRSTSCCVLLPASERLDTYEKGGRILTSGRVIMSLTWFRN
jgi:hypothetical protein